MLIAEPEGKSCVSIRGVFSAMFIQLNILCTPDRSILAHANKLILNAAAERGGKAATTQLRFRRTPTSNQLVSLGAGGPFLALFCGWGPCGLLAMAVQTRYH